MCIWHVYVCKAILTVAQTHWILMLTVVLGMFITKNLYLLIIKANSQYNMSNSCQIQNYIVIFTIGQLKSAWIYSTDTISKRWYALELNLLPGAGHLLGWNAIVIHKYLSQLNKQPHSFVCIKISLFSFYK